MYCRASVFVAGSFGPKGGQLGRPFRIGACADKDAGAGGSRWSEAVERGSTRGAGIKAGACASDY